MTKSRLEAFSDGVIAIIITIMVLELKVPAAGDPEAISHLGVQFISYVMSFVYVAIYWNNHHHMLHTAHSVNGRILWMNTLLLFFLSLFPFCTAWVGESHMASLPMLVYGVVLMAAGLAYYVLAHGLVALHGPQSLLARAIGGDIKGKISVVLYFIGILCAYWQPLVSFAFYACTALLWLVPDQRIERLLLAEESKRPKARRIR